MATYFAADHVVWAHQIGLLNNKAAGERAQKVAAAAAAWPRGPLCSGLHGGGRRMHAGWAARAHSAQCTALLRTPC